MATTKNYTLAGIGPYDIGEDFVEYKERFECFLEANGVADAGKKRFCLLLP